MHWVSCSASQGVPGVDILGEDLTLLTRLSAAAIFEASKPTLPSSQRVIKNDEDMARLALARLYGSSSLNERPTMSRIYECLPSWDESKLADYNADLADATIDSLGDFVTPSISRPSASPSDLMVSFNPLPLGWRDPCEVGRSGTLCLVSPKQERHQGPTRKGEPNGAPDDDMDGIERWEWLLEDMIKLTGSEGPELRGAFGLMSAEEIVQIVIRFDLAKTMLRDNRRLAGLRRESVEELCLACSHEFYDNAASGNYKVGVTKLAYECLDVTFPTDRIVRERDTATDVLDVHANLLPMDLMVAKVAQRAAVWLATLPSSHQLHPMVKRAARTFVRRHLSPLHWLMSRYDIQPNKIETIQAIQYAAGWGAKVKTRIDETKEEQRQRDGAGTR
ncbi:hypothetical protein CYLTODRAFT_456406 [Cylindrobasidium torrendii FP15055 ss-10]|uniref:Sec39 domain-containing protein n=1 Tax=Cylindrobasidium torrendii FP15055 ss-10 TaxID=1314674 RepID=A0A0D7B584_9AGAR|nr:hypothetical protein CYLTODRAFT_456406 [Cylindrobasidium torrendii FP15055 ss-10]